MYTVSLSTLTRAIGPAALLVLSVTAAPALAHNYNNSRSNRSTIASGGDVSITWWTGNALFLDVGDYDGDSESGGDPFFELLPSSAGILLPYNTNIGFPSTGLIPLEGRRTLPTSSPASGQTLTGVAEEFGGSGMNLSRTSHTLNSFGPGTFDAVSQNDAMISDLGSSVAVTTDRLTINAITDAQLDITFDAFGDLDLDLTPGQDATSITLLSWSFWLQNPGGSRTTILGGSIIDPRSTLDGLNPNGITPFSITTPSFGTINLDAGSTYGFELNVASYVQIVPSPSAAVPFALALFAARRRR